MRLFQSEILDERLEVDGAGAGGQAFSSNGWSLLLARAETLKFFCIVDQVVGSPTLTVHLLGSTSDISNPEFTKSSLVPATGVSGGKILTGTFGSGDTGFPPPRHLIAWAILSGNSTKAHVRIWVCGRGPQLLEAIPPAAASFRAQYAAAKMLDDEDSVSLKKQSLRPGASLFYPPELSDPSLKWER